MKLRALLFRCLNHKMDCFGLRKGSILSGLASSPGYLKVDLVQCFYGSFQFPQLPWYPLEWYPRVALLH